MTYVTFKQGDAIYSKILDDIYITMKIYIITSLSSR